MYNNLLSFVETHTAHFDESHDIKHALAVFMNAVEIAKNDYPGFNDDILLFACLLHDVCDHKYPDSIDKYTLESFIRSMLPEKKAQVVIDVINNISYSQEVRGLRKTLPTPYNIYQDIVSDADKLEALGEVGLNRCITFTKQRGGHVPDDVIIHCHEKLLRLKDHFIRTPTGKRLAEPLHETIVKYVEDNSCVILS